MYRDINGKIGTRKLQGLTYLYLNAGLMTAPEIDAMLEDGISQYQRPAPPPPAPQQLEQARKRAIRSLAASKAQEVLTQGAEDGQDPTAQALLDLAELVSEITVSLVAAGVMEPKDFPKEVRDSNGKGQAAKQYKAAAKQAIKDGLTPEEFQELLQGM